MKNIVKILVVVVLAIVGTVSVSQSQVSAQNREPISVGILQYSDHGAMNESTRGILAGLNELGYVEGENLTVNYQTASEVSQLPSIAASVEKDSDYLFSVSTLASQALANTTQDKLIVFMTVSDPVGAGLVDSLEEPGRNLTGTTNIGPIERQITEILLPLIPEGKKIGLIYNLSESNAQYQIDIAIPIIESHGLEAVIRTVSSTNDVSQAMNALVNEEVDGIYLVTDNYVASSMTLVGEIAKEAGIPIVGGSNDMIEENGLATYGLDYYELGRQTAEVFGRILDEGQDPATVPVELANYLELIVNEDYANAIDIDPASIYSLIEE